MTVLSDKMPILKIGGFLLGTPNGDDREKKTTQNYVKYITLYINNDFYLNTLFFFYYLNCDNFNFYEKA